MATKNNPTRNQSVLYPPEKYKKKLLMYLFWYHSIDDITNNDDLNSVYKGLPKKVRKMFPNGSIKIHTKKDLNDSQFIFDFSSDRLYCTRWNDCSQIIALLRHLRNSIAHGRITWNSKKCCLSDKDTVGSLTAKGEISESTITSLIDCILSY